jgi:hypothetical protein
MKVTGHSPRGHGIEIPSQSRVAKEITSVLEDENVFWASIEAVIVVKGWDLDETPPEGMLHVELYTHTLGEDKLVFESIPNTTQDRIKRMSLQFFRVVNNQTSTEYEFDGSGNLIKEPQYERSGGANKKKTKLEDNTPAFEWDEKVNDRNTNEMYQSFSPEINVSPSISVEVSGETNEKSNINDKLSDNKGRQDSNPAYVSSVADHLTTKANQCSNPSECTKYLKELRDILVESDFTGPQHDNILDDLEEHIYYFEHTTFDDDLYDEKIRQIEDISHRIDRMCARNS